MDRALPAAALAAAAAALALAGAGRAHAGGMLVPVQGVHALARGGALVAGAEDADALWLDPAGLAHLAGTRERALLFDVAYLYQAVDYQRIDADGNTLAAVSNQQPGTALPTLAGAIAIGPRLVLAGGISAPALGLHRYAADGAQRYASVGLAGSTFVLVTAGAGYAVSPRLRVGATLQDLVSSLDARIAFSACPGAMTCDPEDKTFDGLARVQQTDHLSPSGSVGVQLEAAPGLTLGATLQAPARVAATGTLTTTLPSSLVFTGASVAGDRATLAFTLPPIARLGVEWRPLPALRVEAALDVELWSLHHGISIAPDGVQLDNVSGTSYALGTMTIARHDRTSFAPSLGAELHTGPAMFGAGLGYETAATPAGEVSVLTIDAAKLLVGAGGGYAAGGWQIGGAAGYVRLAGVDVPLAAAKVGQLQPLRPTPAPVFVNAGSYRASYLVAGIRAARRF